jgi:hypothetical protein
VWLLASCPLELKQMAFVCLCGARGGRSEESYRGKRRRRIGEAQAVLEGVEDDG